MKAEIDANDRGMKTTDWMHENPSVSYASVSLVSRCFPTTNLMIESHKNFTFFTYNFLWYYLKILVLRVSLNVYLSRKTGNLQMSS